MRPESIARIIKLGLINFWRNRWLSVAATMIMTMTLLIISFFVVSTLAIGKTTADIREKMDVSVYFKDSISIDQIVSLQKDLATRADVKEIKYISKDDAKEICLKNLQCRRSFDALDDENQNPLPRSLDIKAGQPESLVQIVEFVKNSELKDYIDNISYQDNKSAIDKLIAITSFMKEFGWMICTAFIIISILVSLNTIGLTIFSRRDEIEIMRLVGANDAFIKVPFIIEGFLQGFLATIFAIGGVWVAIAIINPRTQHYFGSTVSQRMVSFFFDNFWMMLLLELTVGVIIGISCSLISIRKHLKV